MSESRHLSIRRWGLGAAAIVAAVAMGWYLGERVGDGAPPADEAVGPTDVDGEVHCDVAGRIVRLAPEDGVMTVDHEEIEGFMRAMVMDLQLADPAELEGLSSGDEILFDLARIGDTYKAVRIRSAAAESDPAPSESDDAEPANPLGRGDLVPDIELYSAQGDRFRLSEMEPRHKVLTFFYARCPLQDFCLAQSQRLAQLQEHIEASGSDVHLLSLTLDAEHDRPEVLAGYAAQFEADPDRWTLAGSDDADAIRQFADRAGARITVLESGYDIDHALIALRIDDERIVDIVYGLEAIESLVRNM